MSVSISSTLIHNVRLILRHCIREVKKGKGVRQDNNGFCFQAIPAYIVAVTAVEVFLNENYLGAMAKIKVQNRPEELTSFAFTRDLERLELGLKLRIVPYLRFQETFDESVQPYQDMRLLISIRNALVHYRTDKRAPSCIEDLKRRKIALQDQHLGGAFPWPHAISCTEGVRWAHNTACQTINKLMSFDDDFPEKEIYDQWQVYAPISEATINQWYEDLE